jgi:hypothetical protein
MGAHAITGRGRLTSSWALSVRRGPEDDWNEKDRHRPDVPPQPLIRPAKRPVHAAGSNWPRWRAKRVRIRGRRPSFILTRTASLHATGSRRLANVLPNASGTRWLGTGTISIRQKLSIMSMILGLALSLALVVRRSSAFANRMASAYPSRARVANAARHQFGQCLMAKLVGEDIARTTADLHEAGATDQDDSQRDQANNRIGRANGRRGVNVACTAAVEANIASGNYDWEANSAGQYLNPNQ